MTPETTTCSLLPDRIPCPLTLCLAALALSAALSASATAAPVPVADSSAFVMVPVSQTNIRDRRAQFRNVFCAVLQGRTAAGAPTDNCERHLLRLSDEEPQQRAPVQMGASRQSITVAFVAGLGSGCAGQGVEADTQFKEYLARFGYGVETINVSGVSSSAQNARYIRDNLSGTPDTGVMHKVVIVAHSKGVVDVIEALTAYPELRGKIVGVVSLAGAIGGSPLARLAPESALSIVQETPGLKCRTGDGGALVSLRPRVRQDWLSKNQLPAGVSFYSIVALPTPERVSSGLKPSYTLLSRIDPRNDGNLLFYDQVIPGSTLLGYVNADHWAIATNLGASPYALVRKLANKSDFPREALVEAALRFIEQDLATLTAR